DFIAAARRAARLAAEETDTISRVAPARKTEKLAKGEKPASALSRHRRPILLAVGAVLLAIMSYPLVSTLVAGDEAPVVVEQTAITANETAPVETTTGTGEAVTANTAAAPVVGEEAVTDPAPVENGDVESGDARGLGDTQTNAGAERTSTDISA